jgi:hypothetical protein
MDSQGQEPSVVGGVGKACDGDYGQVRVFEEALDEVADPFEVCVDQDDIGAFGQDDLETGIERRGVDFERFLEGACEVGFTDDHNGGTKGELHGRTRLA